MEAGSELRSPDADSRTSEPDRPEPRLQKCGLMSCRRYEVPATNLITKLAAAASVTAFLAVACSWDYPVWPKSKKSDTPLFRFVVNERNGAGYIDRDGKVV